MNETDSELMKICSETCLAQSGVSRMTSRISAADSLKGIPYLDTGEKGVRLTRDNGAISVDLYLRVRYGESIPALAWNIPHSVEEALKKVTKDKIKEINIHIQGVDL